MLIGYARVSTGEQNLDLQIDALKQAGCGRVFSDEMSGVKAERPGLVEALSFLRPDDTLVVWRLDRLGRSLKDLVARVEELRNRGIGGFLHNPRKGIFQALGPNHGGIAHRATWFSFSPFGPI